MNGFSHNRNIVRITLLLKWWLIKVLSRRSSLQCDFQVFFFYISCKSTAIVSSECIWQLNGTTSIICLNQTIDSLLEFRHCLDGFYSHCCWTEIQITFLPVNVICAYCAWSVIYTMLFWTSFEHTLRLTPFKTIILVSFEQRAFFFSSFYGWGTFAKCDR